MDKVLPSLLALALVSTTGCAEVIGARGGTRSAYQVLQGARSGSKRNNVMRSTTPKTALVPWSTVCVTALSILQSSPWRTATEP